MRKGAKREAEELSAGKGLSSTEQLTSEVSKKMQEDYQSALQALVTTPQAPSDNSLVWTYFC